MEIDLELEPTKKVVTLRDLIISIPLFEEDFVIFLLRNEIATEGNESLDRVLR